MPELQKAFSKQALQPIFTQIEAVRVANPPPRALPKKSERELKADELSSRFSELHVSLSRCLSWLRQPTAETFSNFQLDAAEKDQAKALAISKRFSERLMTRFLDESHPEAGILFLGFTGTGKTHLAKAILTDLAARKAPGFFIPASEYFDLYTPAYAAKLDQPLWKIRQWLLDLLPRHRRGGYKRLDRRPQRSTAADHRPAYCEPTPHHRHDKPRRR